MQTTALALALTAMTVGALHALAPDHWVPFAALARAQSWSARKTSFVTLLCGTGHVTVSALLGILALLFGRALVEVYGKGLETAASALLIGFGLAYGIWGLKRGLERRWHDHSHDRGHLHAHAHGHSHTHGPDGAGPSQLTVGALFLLACLDPCVAVIPILLAAAPLGALPTVGIVLAYELATLLAMLVLVLSARTGVARLRFQPFERWADAAAGGLIAATGLVMAGF